MVSLCSCGSAKCGPLPPGELSVYAALELLLRLGCAPCTAPSSAASGGMTSGPFDSSGSPQAAEAVEALFADAAAAASHAAAVNLSTETTKQFNKQWLLGVWRSPHNQHLCMQELRACLQISSCRTKQLAGLQHIISNLLQASETLAACTAAEAAAADGTQSLAGAAAAATAAVSTSAAPAPTATAAAATAAAATAAVCTSFDGSRAASATAAVALAVLYAQLCCWLLHQLQQQQLQLLLQEQQCSGEEGRLQRLCRLLLRALATLNRISIPSVRPGATEAAGCPSVLLCRCWQETGEKAQQQQQQQQGTGEKAQLQQQQQRKLQQDVGPRLALCIARRWLHGFPPPAAPTLEAAAAATAGTSGDGSSSAARLKRLCAFAAAEIPCGAFLESIRNTAQQQQQQQQQQPQQEQQQQQQQQQDVLLLDLPLRLCVSTLSSSDEESTEAMGTAAACLYWALSSLGDLASVIPCMQRLLSGLWQQQQQQQQQQQGILLRLLQLMSREPRAAFPLSSLFVQLVLQRGAPEQRPQQAPELGPPKGLPNEEAHQPESHCCRSLLIGSVLALLMQQGEKQEEAARELLRRNTIAATAADVAALCETFSCLSPAARKALLRALLLQQHAKAAGSDGRRHKQQKNFETDSKACCTYTSTTGQLQQQQLLLRCIFSLGREDMHGDECSTLLLLHLWLQQAPQTPLLQLLQQQQELLQLVADAALRCWQHPRRSVYTAARAVWALLQQRCSEEFPAATETTSSSSSSSSSSGSGSLLRTLCVRLFRLPIASRKALYQSLPSLVRAFGPYEVLQLQPLLLQHLFCQLQNRPLRSSAMLVLRALCEELTAREKRQQQEMGKSQKRQQQKHKKQTNFSPAPALRSFLLGPLRKALTGGSSSTALDEAMQQQQQQQQPQRELLLLQDGQGHREYPLLLPFEAPTLADAPHAEALAETVLPLLLQLDPSAAAPLLLALSAQVSIDEVEAVAAAATTTAAATAAATGETTEREGPCQSLSPFCFGLASAPLRPLNAWSVGEAALLAAARAAGLASWETFCCQEKETRDKSSCCCGSSPKPRNHDCTFGGTEPCSSSTACLTVLGCTSSGAPVCYRVSPERLRRGLSSGDKYLRLLLLEALTLHPQTTAAPRCEELQLLLHAARQQLRLGTAAERSQFVAAFERVLVRASNANRLTLAAKDTAALKALADKGCCCCQYQQHREQEQEQEQQQQQQEASCGGVLGCVLLFLKRLHASCLLACYPEAPPDRVLVALAILVSLHSLWGVEECSERHKKRSSTAQAAAAGKRCMQPKGTAKETAAKGCAVAEALGWHDLPVRSHLLALLPVVAGPAPRSLVTRLLQLLPQQHAMSLPDFSQQQQQQQLMLLPSISPTESIRQSVWDACAMLTSLRQNECAAGPLRLQLLLQELFITPLEVPSDRQQQQQQQQQDAAEAAYFELAEETLHAQAAFCAAVETALRRQLPLTVQGVQAADASPAADPSEMLKRINSSGCSCHPARGVLAALVVLTEAAEVRLAAVRADPTAVAAPRMGLHGLLSALEFALFTVKPHILLLPCFSNSSGSCRSPRANCGACSSALAAWKAWQERLVFLLQNTCRTLVCFAVNEDEEEAKALPEETDHHSAAPAADEEIQERKMLQGKEECAHGSSSSSSSSSGTGLPQLQMDCRGHPFLSGEDGVDHEETQQMLAFCSWRAVKAATECLATFWKVATFDEGHKALREGDSQAAAAAATGEAPMQQQDSAWQERPLPLRHIVQQQPLLRLTTAEIAAMGTNLIKFLLSCRHKGAVEILYEALAVLCLRVRSAATDEVRGLCKRWADSIILLLFPTPSTALAEGGQQQQEQQGASCCTSREATGTPQANISSFLQALSLPLSGFGADVALPPPLRKSKSLGLAMTAILGLGQGNAGRKADVNLSHVVSCLLPLAEGSVPRLFASQREAFGAQVHALNLLRSLIAASALAAGADVREAAATADAAVACAQSGSIYSSSQAMGKAGVGNPSISCAGIQQANELQQTAAETEEPDVQDVGVPLAIAALAVAIKAIASRDFPVRSSANSLLVAATKRLAGTDDETQRAPATPFVFCSGAAMRGSAGAANGLLSIDAASLSVPQVQRLIAMALLPLVGSGAKAHSQPRQSQPGGSVQQQHQSVVLQGANFLVQGLAAHGPSGAAAFAATATRQEGCQGPGVPRDEREGLEEGAAVAVLLLLSRADLSTLASNRPVLFTLLNDSRVEEVTPDLRRVIQEAVTKDDPGDVLALAGFATAAAPKSAALSADEMLGDGWGTSWGLVVPAEGCCAGWLRLLLRSLCCCLRSASFASRALAARALASYVLQLAQTQGSGHLLEALVGTVAVAYQAYQLAQTERGEQHKAESPAAAQRNFSNISETAADASQWRDANARSGLVLFLVELLGRPEVPCLLSEAAASADFLCCFSKLQQSAAQLHLVAVSSISAMERLLILQAIHALALAVPEEHSDTLWSLAASATRAALGIAQDETQIDRARVAETAIGRVSFVHHVGLPALQVVAVRILVQSHLRPQGYATATSEGTAAATQTYLAGLNRVAAVLRGALALAVHPQAVEGALCALAKATNRHVKKHRRQHRLSLEVTGSSRGPAQAFNAREAEASADLCRQSAEGFFALWEICFGLLQSPMAADAFSSSSHSREFWQFCYLSPLQISACRALAALALFAAPHEALCEKLCRELSGRTAAAAALLSDGDAANEFARAAWTRLGAALMLCAETHAARGYQQGGTKPSSACQEPAVPVGRQEPGVCFGQRATAWAALWASALLHCAQPTQKLATRVEAAKDLRISGLPSPCIEGQCADGTCATAKLRVWQAALLLLQDEDVWVRETAGAGGSAAAVALYCRLYSSLGMAYSTSHAKDVQQLLAVAASPALSEDPHGVEAGALVQLLIDLLSKMFPPTTSCAFFWQLLRNAHSDAIEAYALRFGINLAEIPESALDGEVQRSDANRRLFDEEPPNMYADPALSAQLAARSFMLVLLQQPRSHEVERFDQAATAAGQKSNSHNAASMEASKEHAVAIAEATRKIVSSTGAAAAALADLSGKATSSPAKISCRLMCSTADGNVNCSSLKKFSETWLIQATERAASEVQAVQAALDTFTAAHAKMGFPSFANFDRADTCSGELVLNTTQHWLFLPAHTALLCSWVLVVVWAFRELPATHKAFTDMCGAVENLLLALRRAAARGQMPHSQILNAADALLKVMNCLNAKGSCSGNTLRGDAQSLAPGIAVHTRECTTTAARRLATASLFLLADVSYL